MMNRNKIVVLYVLVLMMSTWGCESAADGTATAKTEYQRAAATRGANAGDD